MKTGEGLKCQAVRFFVGLTNEGNVLRFDLRKNKDRSAHRKADKLCGRLSERFYDLFPDEKVESRPL